MPLPPGDPRRSAKKVRQKFLVTGVAELDAYLRDVSPAVERSIHDRALRAVAVIVRDMAKMLVPVGRKRRGKAYSGRPGDMRRSIKVKKFPRSRVTYGWKVQSRDPGAPSVEFGNSHQSPDAFLRPAAHLNQNKMAKLVRDAVVAETAKRAAKAAGKP